MSYLQTISKSQDFNYNKSPHIYSYKYNSINKLVHFLLNSFTKSTKFPFVSILLFILVITLNSIQYNNNNRYLQTQVQNSISTLPDSTSFNNILLYIYDTLGINGFVSQGMAHILYFILTYICLALIEMNIGHSATLFFLVICIMFLYFIDNFGLAICYNDIFGYNNRINNSLYCCGSNILFPVLGFVLFIIQKHVYDLPTKFIIWFIIVCVWAGIVLYEKYLNPDFTKSKDGNQKDCNIFMFHATMFIMGIFNGLVLAK